MSDENGQTPSRLVLSNGRPPLTKSRGYMTREQVEQMVMAERAENERMVKWYMQQIPGLCAHIITKMLVDNLVDTSAYLGS